MPVNQSDPMVVAAQTRANDQNFINSIGLMLGSTAANGAVILYVFTELCKDHIKPTAVQQHIGQIQQVLSLHNQALAVDRYVKIILHTLGVFAEDETLVIALDDDRIRGDLMECVITVLDGAINARKNTALTLDKFMTRAPELEVPVVTN